MASVLQQQQLWLPETLRSHELQQQCGGRLTPEDEDPEPEAHDQEAA